uniref:Uncharacterized protein n=1 Tax=Sparus aurata TaxID=8175 RepID=A0A671W548_SPAAU
MKKTFVCDESMIITIPIGSLNDAREGQLMPEKFRCGVMIMSLYFFLFWSLAAVCLCGLHLLHDGIRGLILTLLVVEKLMAVFLIYWLSKAVCRQSFNTLPIILLKQGD